MSEQQIYGVLSNLKRWEHDIHVTVPNKQVAGEIAGMLCVAADNIRRLTNESERLITENRRLAGTIAAVHGRPAGTLADNHPAE